MPVVQPGGQPESIIDRLTRFNNYDLAHGTKGGEAFLRGYLIRTEGISLSKAGREARTKPFELSSSSETPPVAEAMRQVVLAIGNAIGTRALIIETLSTGTMIQHRTSAKEGPRFVDPSDIPALGDFSYNPWPYSKDLPYSVELLHDTLSALEVFTLAVRNVLHPEDATRPPVI